MEMTGAAAHECISEDALAHLKTYKYSSVDKSFLTHYVLRHYWNAFVELLPLWLAPNMVTLIGFFFILGNIVLLTIYIPDLYGPAPSWVYYSFSLGMWMYSTMDNVDGKQARRTGTSSGLGELFDHGIDSLNCTLAGLLNVAAMGYGPTANGAVTALVSCLPMYFSTWETYHTHTLYLGYFNGPTEGLLIASLIMLLSGIFGPEIWKFPIYRFDMEPKAYLSERVSFTLNLTHIWIPILLFAFFVIHLPFCIYNVVQARRAKNLPVLPTFLEWIPMIVFCGANLLWLGSPYSIILSENHLVFYCLMLSLVFGRMTTKVILAHLTRQPFPYWTVLLTPLVGGAVLVNLPLLENAEERLHPLLLHPQTELWYLRAYFVFALVVYSRWAYLVITSICNYLGIRCLTIAPERVEMLRAERRAKKTK